MIRSTVYRLVGILIFLSGVFSIAPAQEVRVESHIDKSSILIGDAITLELSTRFNPVTHIVQFPVLADTFNGFEVVRKGKIDTILSRDINAYKQKYVITHFDSGRWMIPKFKFDIQSKQGLPASSEWSDSLWVNVNTVPVDTSKPFKPIADIRSASRPWQDWVWPLALSMLLLAVLGVGIGYAYKRYKAKQQAKLLIPKRPPLPPHEKALKALGNLADEALHEQGDEKLYYTKLTDILRVYLEEQFGMDCMEKTSSEIMQGVKAHKALANIRQSLRSVLEMADMVKFAKGKPLPEEHLANLEKAKEIIKESFRKYQQQHIEPIA